MARFLLPSAAILLRQFRIVCIGLIVVRLRGLLLVLVLVLARLIFGILVRDQRELAAGAALVWDRSSSTSPVGLGR